MPESDHPTPGRAGIPGMLAALGTGRFRHPVMITPIAAGAGLPRPYPALVAAAMTVAARPALPVRSLRHPPHDGRRTGTGSAAPAPQAPGRPAVLSPAVLATVTAVGTACCRPGGQRAAGRVAFGALPAVVLRRCQCPAPLHTA
ncbi:hypothetical protein AB0D83_22115 [Streptomyces decoyicus]|uniref:hypothetical protein n=1 Tax=Streptomyces decoyicus TaxID=249567 RepID=UPI0033E1E3EA